MKKRTTTVVLLAATSIFLAVRCGQPKPNETTATASAMPANGGFDSQVKWGEHLVQVSGCGDCHTPKKMGAHGPEDDSSLLLSGHPASIPPPPFDQKEAMAKGMAATQTLSAWVGPWGTSFSGNLTPDSTGIGMWKVEQFMKAIREGKFKGLDGGRPLMPPMPWPSYRNFSDDELKAVFAFLQSIKPVKNVVPAWIPPVK